MDIGRTIRTLCRKDQTLYGAFGYRHGMDVSEVYIHQDNTSGITEVFQSLGEAIILLADRIQAVMHEEDGNRLLYNLTGCRMEFTVPNDWRDNGIIRKDIHAYRVVGNRSDVAVAAYDSQGRLIPGIAAASSDLYLALPTLRS